MAIIIASTAAEATSSPFAMAGCGKVMAAGLQGTEYVKVQEEYPDGVYRDAQDHDGLGIVLSVGCPSILVEGYGNYRMYKPATSGLVVASYES